MNSMTNMRTIAGPERHGALRILLGTVLAILMLLASGCVFNPRSPEQPAEIDIEWIPAHQPENVLANMEAAVEARYISYYQDSLHEEFLFNASDRAIAQQPWDQYFEEFGLDRELGAMEALFSQVEALQLDWNYDDEDLEEVGDEAIFRLEDYELTVDYDDGSQRVFSGAAELTLIRTGSEWHLKFWDEALNSAESSWGSLRASQEIE